MSNRVLVLAGFIVFCALVAAGTLVSGGRLPTSELPFDAAAWAAPDARRGGAASVRWRMRTAAAAALAPAMTHAEVAALLGPPDAIDLDRDVSSYILRTVRTARGPAPPRMALHVHFAADRVADVVVDPYWDPYVGVAEMVWSD